MDKCPACNLKAPPPSPQGSQGLWPRDELKPHTAGEKKLSANRAINGSTGLARLSSAAGALAVGGWVCVARSLESCGWFARKLSLQTSRQLRSPC